MDRQADVPSVEEIRRLAADVRRALAHLDAAERTASPLAIRRALGRMTGPARRVMAWSESPPAPPPDAAD